MQKFVVPLFYQGRVRTAREAFELFRFTSRANCCTSEEKREEARASGFPGWAAVAANHHANTCFPTHEYLRTYVRMCVCVWAKSEGNQSAFPRVAPLLRAGRDPSFSVPKIRIDDRVHTLRLRYSTLSLCVSLFARVFCDRDEALSARGPLSLLT